MKKYSMIVVDDEQKARKMILSAVDWQKLNVEVCLEAEDGFSALKILQEKSPDIMILDIKMPGMSGMELLGEMRKRGLKCKIIVSSGYSDFEAARAFLKSGMVRGYLLKPADADQLTEMIADCVDKLEEESYALSAKRDLQKAQCSIHLSKVRDAIFGLSDEMGEQTDCIQQKGVHALIAVASACSGGKKLKDALSKYVGKSGLFHVFRGAVPGMAVMYFEYPHGKEFDEMPAMIERIALLEDCKIGRGRDCMCGYDLGISYAEALFACESGSFIDKNVITMEDIDNVTLNEDDARMLRSLMDNRDRERIEAFLNGIARKYMIRYTYFGKDIAVGTPNIEMIKAYLVRILGSVLMYDENFNAAAIYSAATCEELVTAACNVLLSYMDADDDASVKKRNLIAQAKVYIESHYGEKLTLKSTADAIYLCPSYLSRLFSEVSGETFVEYVTSVRVSRAMEFLLNREFKIYEVAELVGYRNVKHFIRVFKEKTDMTPSQYREKHIFDAALED